MRIKNARLLVLPALLAAFLLSACGSDDGDKPDTEKKEEKLLPAAKSKIPTPEPICPQVAVVRGLDIVQDYGAEIADPSQLVAGSKMLGVEGDCEYKHDADDKDQPQGIDISFRITMVSKRGARLGGTHVGFPIFIAVLDPSGEVLNKDITTVDVKFSSSDGFANNAEAMHVFIPLPKDQQPLGPHYKVLTGFQLSPTQAEQAKAALKR